MCKEVVTGSMMYHKELKGSEVKNCISQNVHKANLLFSREGLNLHF